MAYPTPVPTPTPSKSAGQIWNENFNKAWNQGFNTPSGPPSSGAPGYKEGFSAGQSEYWKRNQPKPKPQPQVFPSATSPSPQLQSQPQEQGSPSMPSNLLEPLPEAPNFDETPFNQLIDQISGLGSVLTGRTETSKQGIQARETQELGELEQNKTEAAQGIEQYKTQAQADVAQKTNEERRRYAELQQGLQSKYGGTTGTGAFAAELAGRQTFQNIGQLNSYLGQELSKSNQLNVNLNKTYMLEKSRIQTSTDQLLKEAEAQIRQDLKEIDIRKAEIGASKAQRKTEALRSYQSLVTDIKARNTSYLQRVDAQAKELNQQLQAQTFKIAYQGLQRSQDMWEGFVKSGTLTDEGLKAAEKKLDVAGGSLQLPPDKKKKDELSNESLSELDF